MIHDSLDPLARGLKAARLAAGLSFRDAADQIGCSISSVYDWETGKSCPSAERLGKLADAYRVSVDILMGRTPPRATKGRAT